jgi:hypothetical protein
MSPWRKALRRRRDTNVGTRNVLLELGRAIDDIRQSGLISCPEASHDAAYAADRLVDHLPVLDPKRPDSIRVCRDQGVGYEEAVVSQQGGLVRFGAV